MNPNESYETYFPSESLLKEPPLLSDSLSIGFTSVVDKLIDNLQIDLTLKDYYTDDEYGLIRDLIVYMISYSATVIQHFPSASRRLDYKKFRVNTVRSLAGKTFITLLATIIRSRIYYNTKSLRKNDRKQYTINAIINELSNIEITKNAKDIYKRRYSLTAKQKNILNKFNISEKDIILITNDINNRLSSN